LNAQDHRLLKSYLDQQDIAPISSTPEAVGADPLGLDIREQQQIQRIHFVQPKESASALLQQVSCP
jgi:hypothetical protein